MTCQHVICRKRQDRQDLQCSKAPGHDGNHDHTIALGWCRRPDLISVSNGGDQPATSGGHLNPLE